MTTDRRPAGAGLVRLYPAAWRARYESEVLAVLEQVRLDGHGRFDLIRGAIDARLHGSGRIPAVAALVAGGLWTWAGTNHAGQPTPADWPGYTMELLPLAIGATVAAIPAVIGCWAQRSDVTGRLGTIAVWVAVLGLILWSAALLVTMSGGAYGWPTAAAQAVGVVGILLVGLGSLRAGEEQLGGLLVIAPPLMLVPWVASWLMFGLAWTLIGWVLLIRPSRGEPLPAGRV